MVFSATGVSPNGVVLPLAHIDTLARKGLMSHDRGEALKPFLRLLAQPPMALTGRLLRKDEFGKTWGESV